MLRAGSLLSSQRQAIERLIQHLEGSRIGRSRQLSACSDVPKGSPGVGRTLLKVRPWR